MPLPGGQGADGTHQGIDVAAQEADHLLPVEQVLGLIEGDFGPALIIPAEEFHLAAVQPALGIYFVHGQNNAFMNFLAVQGQIAG